MKPIYTMIGYDLEESTDVVRYYGAEATGVSELVRVANIGAEIAPAIVDGMCGQCGRKVA